MNQALLLHEMERLFNREELRTLSFDIGVDYENFPETKEGMARELILYCERHNGLANLASRLRQLRPHADWDNVWLDEEEDDQEIETKPELTWQQLMDFAQRQHGRFLQATQGRPGQPGIFVPELYVTRPPLEDTLQLFLASNAAALIILGEPGVGKTNLLCQWTLDLFNAGHAAFYYDCGGSIQADIEDDIARDLNLLIPASLSHHLEKAGQQAAHAEKQILFLFDAINEFRQGQQVGTAILLKRIDDLISRLPKHNVRVIFSCRTIPWRQLKNLDATQLFWHRYYQAPTNAEPHILITQFDDSLFGQAYKKYQAYFQLQTAQTNLPTTLHEQLKRPLLLRIMAETYQNRDIPASQDSLVLSIYQRYYEEQVKTRRDQLFIDDLVMLMFETESSTISLDVLERQPGLRDVVLDETPASSYQRMLAAGVLAEIPGDRFQSTRIRFMYDPVGSFALARYLLRQTSQNGNMFARLLGEKKAFHLSWETAVIMLLLRPEQAVFTEIAQSQDPEQRELAVTGLVEYYAVKPAATTAIIKHLLQIRSAEAQRTGLKAAYLIGAAAQEIFLSIAVSRSRSLRRVTKDTLYLLWRRDPDFVNNLMYALMDQIQLTSLRQTRYALEFIIDLSVTIHINHCDEPGIAQQTSDLYYELMKNRLHLDWLAVGILGPTIEKLVAKTIISGLAKPIIDSLQYTDVVTQSQLSSITDADKRRYHQVLNLAKPGTDLRPALTDIAAMLESPIPFINTIAALPISVHAVADFAETKPVLQQLFDQMNGNGRLWLLLSMALHHKNTPTAWIEFLETHTRRFVEENPETYHSERVGFFNQFDIVFIPLGLAYGKRGLDMPYFETLIKSAIADQSWPQIQRALIALGPVGFFNPQAVFHTMIAAMDRFDHPEIQGALINLLASIRVLHLDEVDVFLQLIDADENLRRQVGAATDIVMMSKYIYRLGIYNNAVYDTLNHPRIRRHFVIGSASVLIDKQTPNAFLAYYAETGMRMTRQANFRLIEWTLPE